MPSAFLALTVLAAVLQTSSPRTAPNHSWQFVGASNDAALFVDDSSVQLSGSLNQRWVIAIPDARSEAGRALPGGYTTATHILDCSGRQDGISKLNVYDATGNLVAEKADVYAISPVAPYSAGELILDYACLGKITTDKLQKLTSLEDVRKAGSAWLDIYDKLEAMKH